MSDTPDLQEIHDFLIEIATEAGKVITSSLPRIDSTGSKKNSTTQFHQLAKYQNKMITLHTLPGSDLVTEYDKAVESMVSQRLKAKYPTYEYVHPAFL